MRKLIKVLFVVFVCMLMLTDIFALTIGDVDKPFNIEHSTNGIGNVNKAMGNIWSTVAVIVQILAVAAVVFAGLRYMFASADVKADIKRSMGILAVGAILVFAATTVIKFVVNVAKNAYP